MTDNDEVIGGLPDEQVSPTSDTETGDVYISPTEMKRLHEACIVALRRYDIATQYDHLFEEIGELIIAKTRRWRNRSTEEDILEELVDVFQCILEIGVHHYGPHAFNAMLKRKNDKFIAKIMEGDLIKESKKGRKHSKNRK